MKNFIFCLLFLAAAVHASDEIPFTTCSDLKKFEGIYTVDMGNNELIHVAITRENHPTAPFRGSSVMEWPAGQPSDTPLIHADNGRWYKEIAYKQELGPISHFYFMLVQSTLREKPVCLLQTYNPELQELTTEAVIYTYDPATFNFEVVMAVFGDPKVELRRVSGLAR